MNLQVLSDGNTVVRAAWIEAASDKKIAKLNAAKGGDRKALDPQLLDSLITAVRTEDAYAKLGVAPPSGDSYKPLFAEPVTGTVVNRGGLNYVGQETEFVFETHNQKDAFAIPEGYVHWILTEKAKPKDHLKEGRTARRVQDARSVLVRVEGNWHVHRPRLCHAHVLPAGALRDRRRGEDRAGTDVRARDYDHDAWHVLAVDEPAEVGVDFVSMTRRHGNTLESFMRDEDPALPPPRLGELRALVPKLVAAASDAKAAWVAQLVAARLATADVNTVFMWADERFYIQDLAPTRAELVAWQALCRAG